MVSQSCILRNERSCGFNRQYKKTNNSLPEVDAFPGSKQEDDVTDIVASLTKITSTYSSTITVISTEILTKTLQANGKFGNKDAEVLGSLSLDPFLTTTTLIFLDGTITTTEELVLTVTQTFNQSVAPFSGESLIGPPASVTGYSLAPTTPSPTTQYTGQSTALVGTPNQASNKATASSFALVTPTSSSTPYQPGNLTGVPHPSSKSGVSTAVIATVVPLVFVALFLFMLIWWRRKNLRRQQEDDVESEATSVTSSIPGTYQIGNHENKSGNSSNKYAFGTSYGSGSSPGSTMSQVQSHLSTASQFLPQKRTRPTPNQPLQIPSPSALLEDPFLTPTSQTSFKDNINTHSQPIRESQIGLAISTPHGRKSSIANSVRTIIHRHSQRFSNPFRNATISMPRIPVEDDESHKENEEIETNQHSVNMTSHSIEPQIKKRKPNGISIPSTTKDGPGSIALTSDAQGGEVSTSEIAAINTPPVELARRWIEVLKQEAAQAQKAAVEAAKQAKELKQKKAAGQTDPPE